MRYCIVALVLLTVVVASGSRTPKPRPPKYLGLPEEKKKEEPLRITKIEMLVSGKTGFSCRMKFAGSPREIGEMSEAMINLAVANDMLNRCNGGNGKDDIFRQYLKGGLEIRCTRFIGYIRKEIILIISYETQDRGPPKDRDIFPWKSTMGEFPCGK